MIFLLSKNTPKNRLHEDYRFIVYRDSFRKGLKICEKYRVDKMHLSFG